METSIIGTIGMGYGIVEKTTLSMGALIISVGYCVNKKTDFS